MKTGVIDFWDLTALDIFFDRSDQWDVAVLEKFDAGEIGLPFVRAKIIGLLTTNLDLLGNEPCFLLCFLQRAKGPARTTFIQIERNCVSRDAFDLPGIDRNCRGSIADSRNRPPFLFPRLGARICHAFVMHVRRWVSTNILVVSVTP